MTANDAYTEPTTGYWQDLTPEVPTRFSATPPYRFGYPVSLPCGGTLVLPLRRLPDGNRAVASLIANQASNIVVAALADHMATHARALDAQIMSDCRPSALPLPRWWPNDSGSHAMSRSVIRANFGMMTHYLSR
jgi:hypothetical protein